MNRGGASEGLVQAAAAFRAFFTALQACFLEREQVLVQLQLALLAREHLLLVGPPGTGKSALTQAALSGIVEGEGGASSVFSRQLGESTVQTDLIGPVDFKVLTETGRTEYLTDEGMLGARFAFLDEVFDGRDMLLRAILNVLLEREFKHGQRVTVGRVQTAVLTSNRYLSEVLERAPELLIAFADRIAFAAYVPNGFAHPRSRASMLERALRGQRPEVSERLTTSALELLQAAVDAVEVPAEVAAALEVLSDGLERRLQAQRALLPGYRPTRLFSQRSLVKAQGVLRAAVVHSLLWHAPHRPLVARLEDLEALRATFILGGPEGPALEALCAQAADPREQAQLEIVRLEREAFDEALVEAHSALADAPAREADSLRIAAVVAAADSLGPQVEAPALSTVLEALSGALRPGPRHRANRLSLLTAARSALLSLRQLLRRELRPGTGPSGGATLCALRQGLALIGEVEDLCDERQATSSEARAWLSQVMHLCAAGLEARALEGGHALPELEALARRLSQEVPELESLELTLGRLDGDPGGAVADLRRRLGRALRTCVREAFQSLPEEEGEGPAALRSLEPLLTAVDPGLGRLREELVEPLLRRRSLQALASLPEEQLESLTRGVRAVLNDYARQQFSPGPLLSALSPLVRRRLEERASALEGQRLESALRPPATLFDASLYGDYVNRFSGTIADGEGAALDELSRLLEEAGARDPVPVALRERLVERELCALEARAGYLAGWFEQLLSALPAPSQVGSAREARETLDRLVKSHFPLLALREGELFRLSSGAARLHAARASRDERTGTLRARVIGLQRQLEAFGQGLLDRLEE